MTLDQNFSEAAVMLAVSYLVLCDDIEYNMNFLEDGNSKMNYNLQILENFFFVFECNVTINDSGLSILTDKLLGKKK